MKRPISEVKSSDSENGVIILHMTLPLSNLQAASLTRHPSGLN